MPPVLCIGETILNRFLDEATILIQIDF
jgi:hypothetical protein